MTENKIKLIELNENIKDDYLSLDVNAWQETFVESPKDSLEAKVAKQWDIDWTIDCIYADNQMIGYVMHGMDVDGNVWIDRFMIDKRYQGHGYGEESFRQILNKINSYYTEKKHIVLSVEKHNAVAIKMYEKYGFKMTNQMDGIYPVMIEEE